MSKSARPTIEQVQFLSCLVCECVELGRDPILWRQHLAAGATNLIPETVALAYEIAAPDRPAASAAGNNGNGGLNPVLIDHGWV